MDKKAGALEEQADSATVPGDRQDALKLIWESEMRTLPGGGVAVVGKKPLKELTSKQAARVLGVSTWTISNLYRLGFLKGNKPGARVRRRDGKASNAALRLNEESVMAYLARCMGMD